MEDQNKRAEAWTHEETVVLIELWGDERVQNELENTPRRNLEVFRRICTDMKDRILDFIRSPQDCRARIKRLKTKYFQVKRQNKKSGGKRTSFPYHERMDTILGSRPSVNPVALSDSLISLDDESDNDGENDPYEAIADTELEDEDACPGNPRVNSLDQQNLKLQHPPDQGLLECKQAEMNLMRMQQSPPPPNNFSHQYQPHYIEKEQAPPPPPQINASPLNQQHYTEMQPMQTSNMGNYQTSDVLQNVRNQMEF
ncbi:Hypothetical predicted protein [Mytilus galloprovincialis]|uniref:Myb/SANT-like DNA-binding domain-containing protein n=1 Tax=Mytilus galloprovincialis TaxID=29158 RepID=A0A8B6GXN8_MYTGA|nr:Hypothetical predicted protein [Mytilus galloprovincialis]